MSQTDLITKEVDNLSKYMKFVQTPTQTRIFRTPPHYQSLKSRGEQDPIFWKEVAMAFMETKYNTDTSRNRYHIKMFQGGLPHEPYLIAIDNKDQVIIGPSKKIVATLSQTLFSLYLHNQWTDFHKLSCAGKPQMRAIRTYAGCTKVTTNNWDIRTSVAVKASSANILWTAGQICTIKLALKSAHQIVYNNIWCVPKQ